MGAIDAHEGPGREAEPKPSPALSEDEQWLRYWAVGIYDLGLSPEEFFDCTPRQLDALIKRHERSKQETEFLFAQLTSCVVNFSPVHPKKPVSVKDFMPSEWLKVALKPKRLNRKTVADSARRHLDMFIKRGNNG